MSIAIRNLSSGQTTSFSIHKIAERRGIPFEEIEGDYDRLEREMLDDYFRYIDRRLHCFWFHWNMRDHNYGFAAIEHRYQVLGGAPVTIEASKLCDLARLIVDIYGPNYIGHPRLIKLMEKNDIEPLDLMSGADEAVAFDTKNFVGLHQSTLRKVDIIENILDLHTDGKLKTDAKFFERHGFYPSELWALIKDHWIVGLLGLAAAIAGLVSFFPFSGAK